MWMDPEMFSESRKPPAGIGSKLQADRLAESMAELHRRKWQSFQHDHVDGRWLNHYNPDNDTQADGALASPALPFRPSGYHPILGDLQFSCHPSRLGPGTRTGAGAGHRGVVFVLYSTVSVELRRPPPQTRQRSQRTRISARYRVCTFLGFIASRRW